MEFAAAALTSIGNAIGGATAAGTAAGISFGAEAAAVGTATATGAAAAGGGLLSALGSTSLWSSILAGGATVASVLGARQLGEERARNFELQARDAETTVDIEEVQGLSRRNSIKAALVQAIGERDVAAAASGIDLSFGTPVTARREAERDAERALSLDEDTETLRKSRLLERAASLRQSAIDARSGGLIRAAGAGLAGAARALRRG